MTEAKGIQKFAQKDFGIDIGNKFREIWAPYSLYVLFIFFAYFVCFRWLFHSNSFQLSLLFYLRKNILYVDLSRQTLHYQQHSNMISNK